MMDASIDSVRAGFVDLVLLSSTTAGATAETSTISTIDCDCVISGGDCPIPSDPAHPGETSPPLPFLDAFKSLVEWLNTNTDLFGVAHQVSVPPPNGMKAEVEKNESLLPTVYQAAYSAPLILNWAKFAKAIGDDPDTLETICGAVYQRNTQNQLKNSLDRLQAVASTLYSSFLNQDKRLHLDLPLIAKLPPLVMFQRIGLSGPFTITPESMGELFGGSVAVVSVPGTYAQHPILWSALSHEVGGHDVLHAQPNLINELKRKLAAGIKDRQMSDLWQHWIDESASDAYGTLLYGPSFVLNLSFFFSALNLQVSRTPNDAEWLRTISYTGPDGELDPHPTDILRLSLGIGVVRALKGLSMETKEKYIKLIEDLLGFLAPASKVTQIELQGMGKFPIKMMQDIAEEVGELIVTAELDCLKGHSIQDLITWADLDENIAVCLANKVAIPNADMTTTHPFKTSAHILSAATLAVLKDPAKYQTITENVNSLLDMRFAKDKIWSLKTLRHRMYIAGRRKVSVPHTTMASHSEVTTTATATSGGRGLFAFFS